MNQPPSLSVCVCSHNPRSDFLVRMLAGLAAQTLPRERWELILVDNASSPPILPDRLKQFEPGLPLRLIREPALGLVPARLAAIAAAAGDILVLVDDDNVLAPDYLAQSLRIMTTEPGLGVLGGRVQGDFELPPPAWLRPFLAYLALRDPGEAPIRGGDAHACQPWFPIGAGMVIRRRAALAYAEKIADDHGRRHLGRRGGQLTGGEDIDMVITTLRMGLTAGYDPNLSLNHLIPADRLQFDYMRRMLYWTHLSCDSYFYAHNLGRPARPWPIEYLTFILQYLRRGAWRSRSLILALHGARGRYAAWRRHLRP